LAIPPLIRNSSPPKPIKSKNVVVFLTSLSDWFLGKRQPMKMFSKRREPKFGAGIPPARLP
jgi:hypothetical protein